MNVHAHPYCSCAAQHAKVAAGMHLTAKLDQGIELSYSTLDALVTEQLQALEVQDGSPAQTCTLLREQIRSGSVDEALQTLHSQCPAALKDQRLLFRLKKQKFVELLRSAGSTTDHAAIACARADLAPLALNAYPEAYLEFKQLLLLLVCQHGSAADMTDKSSSARLLASTGSTGVDLQGALSDTAREELAGMVFQTLRKLFHIHVSPLGLLLRYLLYLHTAYRTSLAHPLPDVELVDSLLQPIARDPPPLPVEHYAGHGFPEADLQAVIQCAGSTRQATLDAMKHAGGSVVGAFASEISRIQLDDALLHELLLEYAAFRGLVECLPVPPSATCPLTSAAATAGLCAGHQSSPVDEGEHALTHSVQHNLARKASHPAPHSSAAVRAGNSIGSPTGDTGSAAVVPDHDRSASGDIGRSSSGHQPELMDTALETRSMASLTLSAHQVASSSMPPPPSSSIRQNLRLSDVRDSPPGKVARWREGAPPMQNGIHVATDAATAPTAAVVAAGQPAGLIDTAANVPTGQELLLQLHRFAKDGRADLILSAVRSADPDFFSDPAHSHLLFDLQRVRYLQLLEAGDVQAALSLARSELTPLADAHPELLPRLKATISLLIPSFPTTHSSGDDGATVSDGSGRDGSACQLPGTAEAAASSKSSNYGKAGFSAWPPFSYALSAAVSFDAVGGKGAVGSKGAGRSVQPACTELRICGSDAESGRKGGSAADVLPTVVTSLQGALQVRLGLQGPRLVQLLKTLLAVHKAWLRHEKMTSDPFLAFTRIAQLRVTPLSAQCTSAAEAEVQCNAAARNHAASNGTAAGGAVGRRRTLVLNSTASAAAAAAAAAAASASAPTSNTAMQTGSRDLARRARTDAAFLAMVREEASVLLSRNVGTGAIQPSSRGTSETFGGAGGGGGGGGGVGALHDEGVVLPRLVGSAQRGSSMAHLNINVHEGSDAGGGMEAEDGYGDAWDEESVLRLMEVLELPRSAAIDMLTQHHGDVEAAVISVLS